jgi:hypothetical protein
MALEEVLEFLEGESPSDFSLEEELSRFSIVTGVSRVVPF